MFGINKNLQIHFIGIGGIGMSGIAHILLKLGYKVSGSDINRSSTVDKLERFGAKISIGHKAENIKDVQLIVYSSAIDDSNPEITLAQKRKIPIVKRAEMLAELMRLKFGIAVAGSHGKTTTTSLLSTIFQENGKNPTCVVGGIVKNLEGQAVSGDSQYLIAEADESDGSFLYLNPIMSVITNIDNDHLDYYKNQEAIVSAFREFANKVPFYGCVAINIDDEKSRQLIEDLKRPYYTFSIRGKADYYATDIKVTDLGCQFNCHHEQLVQAVNLKLSGRYNVLNAIAAIAIAHRSGIEFKDCCHALESFEGVGRRFEYLKKDEELTIVDDYAHHPTELENTLENFVDKFKNYKKIAIFQPHRYSRTKEHWSEFCECFKHVDKVYITPIYAASEEPIEYIDSEIMVKTINEKYQNAEYCPDWDFCHKIFTQSKNTQSAIICLGAGSISREVRSLVEKI